MSLKITSDFNMTNISQPPGSGTTPRVNEVSQARNLPERGNGLPAKPAISGQDSGIQAEDNKQLDDAIKNLNKQVQMVQRELEFSVDKDSGRTVIKVMDLATKEVIRQIPNEEALNFARKLGEGINLELLSEYT